MIVLGIETSCDETGVAIYDAEKGLLAHSLHSQPIHAEYGGVVPELASRDHIRKLTPLIRQVSCSAGVDLHQLNGIAYTAGPGLIGALLVGAATGRSLAWALKVPSIAVHHMEGHLLAPLLEFPAPVFPFIALLVSGGHTQLVRVHSVGRYTIMGESLDDAVGEAFDKTAKMLGLGYPGGPALARLAEQGKSDRFHFPRPLTDRQALDFSFSGLKTHALNTLHATEGHLQDRADIARAFQDAVVDTLLIKCRWALEASGLSRLVVSGGVSANQALRSRLHQLAQQQAWEIFFPRLEFCTDNGAMIAFAGCQRLVAGQSESLNIAARPRWPLGDLTAPGR